MSAVSSPDSSGWSSVASGGSHLLAPHLNPINLEDIPPLVLPPAVGSEHAGP